MKNGFVETITDLYNQLSTENELKSKVSIIHNIIKIIFHEDFRMEICFDKNNGLFNVYINSIFYYGIEDQDILNFIIETLRNMIVIQYKRITPLKKPFKFVDKKSFNKDKWEGKPNVNVFTSKKTIIDTF